MNKDANTLTRKLIRLGVRPKYRGFDYVLFILSTYDSAELINKRPGQLIDDIAYHFGVSQTKVNSNLSMIVNSTMSNNKRFYEEMPSLRKGENPALSEFFLILSMMIEDEEL